MKVFLSHSSKDKPKVEAVAAFLFANGIDAWLDQWEILPGDDLVAKLNEGLGSCDAGLIFLSGPADRSPWVKSEVSYLVYARVQEGKTLIPVVVDGDAAVPPLLRPLIRVPVDDHARILDALIGRSARPLLGTPAAGRTHRLKVLLERRGEKGLGVVARLDGAEIGAGSWEALPPDVEEGRRAFLNGGVTRRSGSNDAAIRKAERELDVLGAAMRDLLLPGNAAETVTALLDGVGRMVGTTIEVDFESSCAEWLGLPFDAVLLADGRPLVLVDNVVVRRRAIGLPTSRLAPAGPPAGPLKILAVVGGPDEARDTRAALDVERELQNILDAVDEPRRLDTVEVRFLEIGHPDQIGAAFQRDAYHVLHLICHGEPGRLAMETEDGEAVWVSAAELLRPIKAAGRRLPLVFVNACHGGALEPRTMSTLACDLLAEGVDAVVAMQTAISDAYATELARVFYTHLGRSERPLAGRALASARRELESARKAALADGDVASRPPSPEFATPALFVGAVDEPLADFAVDREPLRLRPVHEYGGPVPQLSAGDLVGRRRELRETLAALRGRAPGKIGAALTGLGGVGKSAIAGRAIRALAEARFHVAAHVGRLCLGDVAAAVGTALAVAPDRRVAEIGEALLRDDLRDIQRLTYLDRALGEVPVLLVLDDFEQNLTPVGGYREPGVGEILDRLLRSARTGRILITSRYAIPRSDAYLTRIDVGPLSSAETRKLLIRLPALSQEDAEPVRRMLAEVGGHPRLLEFIDGLLRAGSGRLPAVTDRLANEMRAAGFAAAHVARNLETAQEEALILGVRGVVFDELKAAAERNGDDAVFLQAAVSNVPVPKDGVAQMLDETASPETCVDVARRLGRLRDLSLAHMSPDGSVLVHRWIADAARSASDPVAYRDRCRRAGGYRWRRVERNQRAWTEAVESVRNFMAGEDWESAGPRCRAVLQAFKGSWRLNDVATFAAEFLAEVPEEREESLAVAVEECRANEALGNSQRALARWESLFDRFGRMSAAERSDPRVAANFVIVQLEVGSLYRRLGMPDRADGMLTQALKLAAEVAAVAPKSEQSRMSMAAACSRLAELALANGQNLRAFRLTRRAHAIYEQVSADAPDPRHALACFAVVCRELGDHCLRMGRSVLAHRLFLRAFEVAKRLSDAEPHVTDFRVEYAKSCKDVGRSFSAKGAALAAREMFEAAVSTYDELVDREPERTDLRFASVNVRRVLGAFLRDRGEPKLARRMFSEAYDAMEALVAAEPRRTDFQRILSVCCNHLGDVYCETNESQSAEKAYRRAFAVAERLAAVEPDRAEFRRELAVCFSLLGAFELRERRYEDARASFLSALSIREQLVERSPKSVEAVRDLSLSYDKLGSLHAELGEKERAERMLEKSLALAENLAAAEPRRSDFRHDVETARGRLAALKAGTFAASRRLNDDRRAPGPSASPDRIPAAVAATKPNLENEASIAAGAVAAADPRPWWKRMFGRRR